MNEKVQAPFVVVHEAISYKSAYFDTAQRLHKRRSGSVKGFVDLVPV
jgi:hypothetical protein